MRNITIVLLSLILAGCNTSKFHFLDNSALSIDREKSLITNSRTGVRYPLREDIFSSNYTGDYDLHSISGDDFNKKYEVHNLIKECITELPFRQKNVEFVYADKCVVLWIDHDYRSWAPNYVFMSGEDSSEYVQEKSEWNKTVALAKNTCWRNLLISRRKRRILCVDRVLHNDKASAIVYIMQAERQSLPFPAFYHWNITRSELLPHTGYSLNSFADVTRDILEANRK